MNVCGGVFGGSPVSAPAQRALGLPFGDQCHSAASHDGFEQDRAGVLQGFEEAGGGLCRRW